MAKKDNTSAAANVTAAPAPEIDDATYYRVEVSGRFKALGVGFGPQSETQVTGELLRQVLASEFASKVTGYTAI